MLNCCKGKGSIISIVIEVHERMLPVIKITVNPIELWSWTFFCFWLQVEFEKKFRSYCDALAGNDGANESQNEDEQQVTFNYLKSFKRVRINYTVGFDAICAKVELHQTNICGSLTNVYLADQVSTPKNPNSSENLRFNSQYSPLWVPRCLFEKTWNIENMRSFGKDDCMVDSQMNQKYSRQIVTL